jgi:hypothetical protein
MAVLLHNPVQRPRAGSVESSAPFHCRTSGTKHELPAPYNQALQTVSQNSTQNLLDYRS